MLRLNNVQVIYSNVILVLKGLSLDVEEGRIVALLGANGAGKSTTLKAISGLLKTEDGAITRGEVRFAGERLNGLAPDAIVRRVNRDLVITILLVEQNARLALEAASYGYIMEQGKVVLDGTAAELAA